MATMLSKTKSHNSKANVPRICITTRGTLIQGYLSRSIDLLQEKTKDHNAVKNHPSKMQKQTWYM